MDNKEELEKLQNEIKKTLDYVDRMYSSLESLVEELGKQKLEAGAGVLKDFHLLCTMINGMNISDISKVAETKLNNFSDVLRQIEVISQFAANDIKNPSKDIRLSWGLDGSGVVTFIMSETVDGPGNNNWNIRDAVLGNRKKSSYFYKKIESNLKDIPDLHLRNFPISQKETLKNKLEIAKKELAQAKDLQEKTMEQQAIPIQKVKEGVKKLIALIKDEETFLKDEKQSFMEMLKRHLNWDEFSEQEKREIGYILYCIVKLKELIEAPLLTGEGSLTEQVIELTGLK